MGTTAAEPLHHRVTGTGPPLLLVHGLTFSAATWDPVVDLLRDRFRCIAVDLPGHGGSGGSAADPPAVVDRLHATVLEVGAEAPVVVGHSAGVMVVVGYAARFPVAGVVDVDQPLLVGPFAAALQQQRAALEGSDFEGAFAPFEHSIGVHRLPDAERARVAATRRVDQGTVLDHWHFPMSTEPSAVQAMVDGLLEAIDVPCLYVAGEDLPAPVLAHLTARLPGLEVVTWPGCGHLVHLAESRRFAELLADFAERARVECVTNRTV